MAFFLPKKRLILSILTIALLGVSCTDTVSKEYLEENAVYWSKERNLNWSDFKGEAEKGNPESNYYVWSGFYYLDGKLASFFDSGKSWVKDTLSSKADDQIKWLNVLFDLNEVYCQNCNRALFLEFGESEPPKDRLDELCNYYTDRRVEVWDNMDNSYYDSFSERTEEWKTRLDILLAQIDSIKTW